MTLFTADITKAPQNARLNYYLGNEMSTNLANSATGQMKAQIITESIPYLQKAVSINPEYAEAQTTLATAFFNLQQFDSAEVHHLKALSYDSLNALALNGLAGIYFMKQNFPKARDILIRDVAINPRNTSVVHNLGLCYLNMRIYDSCIYYGRKVLAIDASHQETFKDMARA
jgi:Flp pilus assembly protein TadD